MFLISTSKIQLLSKYIPIHYYFNISLHLISFISIYYFKNSFILLYIIYGLIPFLEIFRSKDTYNPTNEDSKNMKNQLKYKIPLYINCLLDWMTLIRGLRIIIFNQTFSPYFKVGLFLSMISCQASSINLSLEFFHKKDMLSKFIGSFHLSKNLFIYFNIEHNYGHHKYVATPEDPVTARKNETFYSFLFRAIIGEYLGAWKIENEKCINEYKTIFTINNKMFWFSLNNFLFPLIIYFFFGFYGMIIHLFVALGSIIVLEAINYVEHYGLLRKKINDKYEEVSIKHSWNSSHMLTNYLLYKLQRHSDHHVNSRKPYQNLLNYDESPQLPCGYSLCILLVFFPSKWFEIMNPILENFKNENIDDDNNNNNNKEFKKRSLKLNKFIYDSNICFFLLIVIGIYF